MGGFEGRGCRRSFSGATPAMPDFDSVHTENTEYTEKNRMVDSVPDRFVSVYSEVSV
jgi:hypothetical protein